ncbi:hypothetical protein ABC365_02285 [Brevundimonas sp. 3P9-tot-E]|uniref:hypothetical protein n=1 Tax=unclassified Brevundimonas TaxID=2622653 RepID=UPI0039A28300
MATRDLVSSISPRPSIAPAVHAATVTGEPVDLNGYESATVSIVTGAIAGDGLFTFKLQDSDTTTSGDFEDVGPASEPLLADEGYKAGYVGTKRYVRAVLTKTSGTSIAAAVTIIRGHPHDRPTV